MSPNMTENRNGKVMMAKGAASNGSEISLIISGSCCTNKHTVMSSKSLMVSTNVLNPWNPRVGVLLQRPCMYVYVAEEIPILKETIHALCAILLIKTIFSTYVFY